MRLHIRHETRYSYQNVPSYAVQRLHLTPADFDTQRTITWRIEAPGIEKALAYRDGFGNSVHLITFKPLANDVMIAAEGIVECSDAHGIVRGLPPTAPDPVFLRQTTATMPNDGMRSIAEKVRTESNGQVDQLHAIMSAVHQRVAYELGATHFHTTAAEAFDDGRGVCQDHTHILIGITRHLGIPSRYVSGYLVMNDGQPATASHAWAEVLVPGLGWTGFDAANSVSPTDHYVRVAGGLDAASIAPVKGTRRGGSGESMTVEVSVQVAEQ
jgi:transglutaminase-like putative cysteine protease